MFAPEQVIFVGVNTIEARSLIVTVIEVEAVQPAALVTVSVYVPVLSTPALAQKGEASVEVYPLGPDQL